MGKRINCFEKLKHKAVSALQEQFNNLVPEDTDLSEAEQKEIGKKIALAHYDKLIDQLNQLKTRIDTKLPLTPLRQSQQKQVKEIHDLFSDLINQEIENGPNLFTTEKPERSTETIVSTAEVAINKGQTAKTEEEVDDAIQKVEASLNEVQSKVGKLTENWSTDEIEHEIPSKVIGKQVKKEITKYAKEIARINGWEIPKVTNAIYDNIAPAGGDVVFHLDIPGTPYRMYVSANYEPEYSAGGSYGDYQFNGFFYRLEDPTASGQDKYKGSNQWQHQNITAKEMAEILNTEANKYIKPSAQERLHPVPMDEWENNLIKARKYAKDLIDYDSKASEFIDKADWTNTESIVAAIKSYLKKDKRTIRDEKLNKDLDDAAKDFFRESGGLTFTSGGIDPVKIEKGVKLIGLYMKAGIYKFQDIIEDLIERHGDKVKSFFEELAGVYGYYYNTKATEEEANKMDRNLRGITFDNLLNKIEDDRRSNNVVEPSLDQRPEGLAANGTSNNVSGNDEGRNAEPVVGEQSGSSNANEGQNGGKGDVTSTSGGISQGQSDVALNGNEDLNEELGGDTEEKHIPEPGEQKPVVSELQHNSNFVIPPDFTNSKSFNVAQKLQDNIDAIKVLVSLNRENRKATYEEQKILFKYVGWGGIKEIGYNPKSNFSWKSSNLSLRPKIQEAHDAITEFDEEKFKENMAAITRSTQNAHYTAIPIIRGMWNVLSGAGFKGGSIVEPSAGVGHFIGAMPSEIRDNSKITAIELDNITGHVLRGLYPNINTKISGYEDVNTAPGSVDLLISNIPFGKASVLDKNFEKSKDPVLIASQNRIHSYFFARAIQDVAPNGTIAFVTSTGVLDSPINADLRKMMADRTEFLGAIRLPNDSFRGNANTQVTTDIIFLRKLSEAEKDFKQPHSFVDTKEAVLKHKDKDQTFNVRYNEYFHDNPEMVLGETVAFSMYGSSENSDDVTVMPTGINLEEGISKLGEKIFKNKIAETEQKTKADEAKETAQKFIKNNGQRPGNIVEISPGQYGIFTGEIAINPELDAKARSIGVNPDNIRSGEIYSDDIEKMEKAGLKSSDFEINQVAEVKIPKKYIGAVKDLIPLRNTLNELYAAEYGDLGEGYIAEKRQDLNRLYNKFVKNNGTLLQNNKLLDYDIDGHNIAALENVKEKKVVGLADIFKKRIFQRQVRSESAQDISEAIAINLNEQGSLDIDRLAELLKKTPEQVIEEGKGLIYKNPVTGYFETKDHYLSGNVRKKLKEAQIAVAEDKFYEDNVTALEAAQPTDLMASQIYAPISAPWIDIKYLNQFASHIFQQNINITKLSTGRVSTAGGRLNTQVTDVYGTNRMNGFEILSEAVQNRMPIIRDTFKGPPQVTVLNEKATKEANDKVNKIRQDFDNWLWQDDARRQDLVNHYNQNYNNTVTRKYDGSKLTFSGYAGPHTPKSHQLDGIWMIIQQLGGILDHRVGSGKSLLMVLAANKMKQMGLIKKPIIVGLKANTADLAKTYKESFPMAKVLFPKEKDFTPERRRAFFAKMANNDWDAIVMTHDQFGMIEQSREIQQEIIQQEIDALENDIRAAKDQNLSKRDLNGLEVRKQNLGVRLQRLLMMPKDASLKSFEEMGIDFMFVDESQQFKNLAYNTIQRGIAGLGDPSGSGKAFNILFAIRTLQKLHGGDKGTVFASGTPISNTMVEMYNLFKYLRPNKLAEMGLNSFDQWANTFAQVGSEIEFGVTNSLKPKVRMRNFMNVPEMGAMYREIADVRNDSNLKLDQPTPKQTIRIKADKEVLAGENVSIEGNKFKVIGRIKGLEKNDYWLSLMSVGNDDWVVPKEGQIDYKGKKINYSESERSDGLLVNIAPTIEQRKYAKKLQKFAATKDGAYIGRRLTDKEKKAYMLLATNLASKMAIDMRLINPSFASTETGKLGVAANYIFDHYKESEKLKGIQLVFSDLGTPKDPSTRANLFDLLESKGIDRETLENIFGKGAYADKQTFPQLAKIREKITSVLEWSEQEFEDAVTEANEDNFNVYQELKDKLIARGIPADEIVFIHDFKSDAARAKMFEDAKSGKIRVIIGSTSKLGTGVNVQDKVVALHHLDVPWRPSDMEQRNGRGIRQGNFIIRDHYNNLLPIYYYATESTLDAYKYQLLDAKQKFINQAKTGDGTAREISEGDGDEESGVSFAAMTAMLSGNPVLLEKAKIDKKVKDLEGSKKTFDQEKYNLKDKIRRLKDFVTESANYIKEYEKDKNLFQANASKDEKTGEWNYAVTIDGQEFTERKKAGEKLLELRKKYLTDYAVKHPEILKLKKNQALSLPLSPEVIGKISGFDIVIRMKGVEGEKNLILNPEIGVESPVSKVDYSFSASQDAVNIAGHLQREIRGLQSDIDRNEYKIQAYQKDISDKENYLNSLPAEFPKQKELEAAVAHQIMIDARLEELAKSKPIPTKEELESLGEPEEFPNEFELENLFAIDQHGQVIAITSDQDLSNALGLKDVGNFGHMVGLAKQDGFRFFTYKEEDRPNMEGEDENESEPEFSVTGPTSDEIQEMQEVVKEQIDLGNNRLKDIQDLVATELDDDSEEMRQLVEDAYHEYGRGENTPFAMVMSVIDRIQENLSAAFGQNGNVEIVPNTTELLKKADQFGDAEFQYAANHVLTFTIGGTLQNINDTSLNVVLRETPISGKSEEKIVHTQKVSNLAAAYEYANNEKAIFLYDFQKNKTLRFTGGNTDTGGRTTGSVLVEQSNKSAENPQFMRSQEGKILGFTQGGNIYLNGKHLNPNTPIHEAGHIWLKWAEKNAIDIYDRGIELVQGSRYLEAVKNNPFYQQEANKPGINTEKYYQHEALAMAIGDKGAQFVTEARKNSITAWLNNLWNAIKNALGFDNISAKDLANMTFDEFATHAVVDILKERQQAEQQEEEENEDIADQKAWENSDPIASYKMTTDGEVNDMLSGKTITETLGYAPEGDQTYQTQKLVDMLQDGKNMIGAATKKWGTDLKDYGRPLLKYIATMSTDTALQGKKAVLLATLLGEIREEINRNPNRADELRSLDNAATAAYQNYMNNIAKSHVAGRLLRLYRDKYMGDIFANQILEEQEIKDQNDLRKFEKAQMDIDARVAAGIEEYKRVTQQEKDIADAEAAAKNTDNIKAKNNKKKMSPVDAQKNAAAKAEEIKKKGGMADIVDRIKNFIDKCK